MRMGRCCTIYIHLHRSKSKQGNSRTTDSLDRYVWWYVFASPSFFSCYTQVQHHPTRGLYPRLQLSILEQLPLEEGDSWGDGFDFMFCFIYPWEISAVECRMKWTCGTYACIGDPAKQRRATCCTWVSKGEAYNVVRRRRRLWFQWRSSWSGNKLS